MTIALDNALEEVEKKAHFTHFSHGPTLSTLFSLSLSLFSPLFSLVLHYTHTHLLAALYYPKDSSCMCCVNFIATTTFIVQIIVIILQPYENRVMPSTSNVAPRKIGHVKFFNSVKGYGFIIPDDSTADQPIVEGR